MSTDEPKQGPLARLIGGLLEGPGPFLLLLLAFALGTAAVLVTPREEEPQIVVPMADVFVEAPGHSAEEIEGLVTNPLSRLLWQIDGVEHVQSATMRDRAIVTVRFFVGEDREDSITLLRNRIQSNLDQLPPIVESWLVRPIEIDDVPIVALTISGEGYDLYQLRRIAEEVRGRLDRLPELSRTEVVGGFPREIRVELERDRLEGHDVTALEVAQAISGRAQTTVAGTLDRLDGHFTVDVGDGFDNVPELMNLEVAVRSGVPVRLRQVARVVDGPREPESYTRIATGAASEQGPAESVDAVTIAVAKQKGTDATAVAGRVLAEVERLRADVLPDGISVRITRNSGVTADQKVDELLESIVFALITVVALLLFSLGWREALVVALSVPFAFALTLFANLVLGYTINRVTLFALILSLGLVVDDPIANVDNIERHLRLGKGSVVSRVLAAVSEVLPPVIMSTLTIIVSFLPMFFITGMMGPYMQPMAANVPLAVGFSTLAALTVVPWLSQHLLGRKARIVTNGPAVPGTEDSGSRSPSEPFIARLYRRTISPLVSRRRNAWMALGAVLVAFAGANVLALTGLVPLKMLPFADKDELQVVVDMPEGTTLERTDAVVREMERFLVTQPDVESVQSYVGEPSPMDFIGMVRHAYLRKSPELADLRIELVPADDRSQQSHSIGLRIRDSLAAIADRHGAQMQLVEAPPGPPVLATVVAEVYGEDGTPHDELIVAAHEVAARMRDQEGVREVDVMTPAPRRRLHYGLDRRQAAVHGVDESQVSELLGFALAGRTVATLRDPHERQPLPVRLRLPIAQRSDAEELSLLSARTRDGSLVGLRDIGSFESSSEEVIHQKDLQPVVYVTGEAVGVPPAEAVLALSSSIDDTPLAPGITVDWAGEGEWDVTIRAFRDLGLAFGAALVLIYLLLVVETRSFAMPVLVMMAIPLTAIGIMPGFWLLNVVTDAEVGGYADPVFFTATAMIGMIALGGIVVRNSLVLLEFMDRELKDGTPLREAILRSGAVRMRPILLTAGTTALGAWPITLDPVFSGLAWSLVFGLIASTLFTLVVVPAAFYLLRSGRVSHRDVADTERPADPAGAAPLPAA